MCPTPPKLGTRSTLWVDVLPTYSSPLQCDIYTGRSCDSTLSYKTTNTKLLMIVHHGAKLSPVTHDGGYRIEMCIVAHLFMSRAGGAGGRWSGLPTVALWLGPVISTHVLLFNSRSGVSSGSMVSAVYQNYADDLCCLPCFQSHFIWN